MKNCNKNTLNFCQLTDEDWKNRIITFYSDISQDDFMLEIEVGFLKNKKVLTLGDGLTRSQNTLIIEDPELNIGRYQYKLIRIHEGTKRVLLSGYINVVETHADDCDCGCACEIFYDVFEGIVNVQGATIDVDSTVTVDPDQPANVENIGTDENVILRFEIPRGQRGLTGLGLEFDWQDTQLGVRVEGDANYQYVDLKGDKGDNLEFTWRGTELGVRVEGEEEYQYVNLKGDTGNVNILNSLIDYKKLSNDYAPYYLNLSTSGVLLRTPNQDYYANSHSSLSNWIEIDNAKNYYYTGEAGEIENEIQVAYINKEGSRKVLGFEKFEPGKYIRKKLDYPAETRYIAISSKNSEPFLEEENTIVIRNDRTVYVSKQGDDENIGSRTYPFSTINRGIQELINQKANNILIFEGDYYERLNTRYLLDGEYKISNYPGDKVRVLGSDKLTGWQKTSGYNNIYEISYSENIQLFNRYFGGKRLLFEDGNPSRPISNEERHPAQKNNKFRLPFTVIEEVGSVNDCESTPGSFCIDSGSLYIHTSNSDNPEDNEFEYHNPMRDFNNRFAPANIGSINAKLTVNGLQFIYGTNGFSNNGFSEFIAKDCSFIVVTGNGCVESTYGLNRLTNCEAAFSAVDGFNCHFAISDTNQREDNRSNYNTVIYENCWAHDNHDDGESSHESSNVIMNNCLLEYNTKSGTMGSNSATYNISNTVSRHNKGSHIGYNLDGFGFAAVNANTNPNKIGAIMNLNNCISYGNGYGYGVQSADESMLIANNCISRNNEKGELNASKGVIIARNCRASNEDGNIVIEDEGAVIIENDDLIVL